MAEPLPMSFQTVLSQQQVATLQVEAERLKQEHNARLALRAQREALEHRVKTMNTTQLAQTLAPHQAEAPQPDQPAVDVAERDHYEKVTSQGGFPPPPTGPHGGT